MFTIVIFCSQDCGNVDKYVDKRSKLWISSNEATPLMAIARILIYYQGQLR